MSKNKSETKVEPKSEGASATAPEAAVAPAVEGTIVPAGAQGAPAAPVRSTALVLASANIHLATPKEMEDFDVLIKEKFDALVALTQEVTGEVKDKLLGLIEQANPVKEGMEEMEMKRGTEIPRVNIVQPTSNKPCKPEAARPGDLYTDNGAMLDRPFEFIPVYFYEEHVNFPQGAKFPECKAPDAKYGMPYGLLCLGGAGQKPCDLAPFGKQNGGRGDQKQVSCFAQVMVVCITKDLSALYVLPYGKTSYGAGQALARMARGQTKPWKQSYLLDTEKKTGNAAGQSVLYYVAKTAPTGKDNTPEAFKIAGTLAALCRAQRQKSIADYYLKVENAPQTALAAEHEFSQGQLDTGDGGGEPNVMPDSQASVKTGKPM